jgi:hypothetical protein
MTEAVGASDLISGQMTTEAAQQQISARINDADFRNRLLQKEEAASAEWSNLHKAAYPAPVHVTSVDDVNAQAAARNEQMWSGYIGALKQRFSLTSEQEAEIRGGVIRADFHQWAREEKDRLIKDPSFRRKLLDGSRAENQQWGMITSMLSLRPMQVK